MATSLLEMAGPIGERQHRVTVEVPTGAPTSNAEGNWDQAMGPATPATWWCRIRPATVRDLERVAAGTVLVTASHILEGVYHPGITTSARLGFNGRTFFVRGVVNPEERNIATVALCQEMLA